MNTPTSLPGMFELPFTAYSPGLANGRVNLSADSGTGKNLSIPGFQYRTDVERQFQQDMLRGNWEETPLSRAFFTATNVKTIQNLIRRAVFDKSQPKGYVIDDQSVDELKIIMRAIYLQYGRNIPTQIPQQVDELNQRVADWCVPHILSAVDHYHYYLDDISKLPVPMAQPVNVSRSGTKTLPTNQFM
jgi:Family of unknown function (DUF5761)